jgi:hypothetical protein
MSVVVIYGFSAKYGGNPEFEWNHPEVGNVHQCLLFLRQSIDSDEYELALSECRKFGFDDVSFTRRGALKVEVLNTDMYRGFAGFYEEALRTGSALVYYP